MAGNNSVKCQLPILICGINNYYRQKYLPQYMWWAYRMAGNFRGKSEKALRIKFCGFKFCDSNPVQGHDAALTMM